MARNAFNRSIFYLFIFVIIYYYLNIKKVQLYRGVITIALLRFGGSLGNHPTHEFL